MYEAVQNTVRAVREDKQRAAQQRAMHNFVRDGTLSGDAPVPVTNRLFVNLAPDSDEEERPRKKRRLSRRVVRRMQARATAERTTNEAALRARAEVDGDHIGRYPIAGFSDVRVMAGKRRRVQAYIQWAGERWAGTDSWEPAENLTADIRAQVMEEANRRFPRHCGGRTLSRKARRALVRKALVGGRLLRTDGSVVYATRGVEGMEICDATEVPRKRRVVEDEPLRWRKRRKKSRIRTDRESDSDGDVDY